MSAVLVDVCKTQSFHCKKEQNVQIKLDIKYTSCGADAEILTIKAFYYLLIISFSFPVIFTQLIEQCYCKRKLIVGIRWGYRPVPVFQHGLSSCNYIGYST